MHRPLATTDCHTKIFAATLRQQMAAGASERLSGSIANSAVDLNPHQIDAALFAFRSPISRGVILADEVGLGKTIEAGLVISQLWAEHKRRIICIVPASLRKQWNRELLEKFFLPSHIVESRNYKHTKSPQDTNPFESLDAVVICSHEFAYLRANDVERIEWDLVVVDEAHRLRNVYKGEASAQRAHRIRAAIRDRRKLLLTATPLQNSLMELYGLITFVDPHVFGDADSFRAQYASRTTANTPDSFADLKRRIAPYVQRTLRRQVTEYVRFTARISHTQDFTPTDSERQLYEGVSEYLRKESLEALPTGQRTLMTLIVRKILASSSFAIAPTLGRLINRLETIKSRVSESPLLGDIAPDESDITDPLLDEWNIHTPEGGETSPAMHTRTDRANAIETELAELRHYKALAESITHNAKGDALLIALRKGMEKAAQLGAPAKALVFTESRRTQTYLLDLLTSHGYEGRIVLFNGTNTDDTSKQIYREWLSRNAGGDRVTHSPTADMRSALVDFFRDSAEIMIATEAAAEGVNLQFCSLVVNYDLPWNPQRIEQRIGRCHRYGQLHDVVVINFLNRSNEADQRVFALLASKFELFDGIFGASDRVLGTIDSGVDFERRILDIYQQCRTADSITQAFNALQQELEEQISDRLEGARLALLEHFDEDVHRALRIRSEETSQQITEWQAMLWRLTRHEASGLASWSDQELSFELNGLPQHTSSADIPLGRYMLAPPHRPDGSHSLRHGHPLAQALIDIAGSRDLPSQRIRFSYSTYGRRVSILEQLIGQSGWLSVNRLSITGPETEDHLLFSAINDNGTAVESETSRRFFSLPGVAEGIVPVPEDVSAALGGLTVGLKKKALDSRQAAAMACVANETEKLNSWAEDLKLGLERDLRGLTAELRAAHEQSRLAETIEHKLNAQILLRDVERRQKEKRRRLFDAHDEIDAERERLISDVSKHLNQVDALTHLLTIRWTIE